MSQLGKGLFSTGMLPLSSGNFLSLSLGFCCELLLVDPLASEGMPALPAMFKLHFLDVCLLGLQC